MGFTNTEQLRELFLSGGMGFLLGGYYDVFRILRRLLHPTKVAVFFQDCFFFASAAVLVFLFSLAMTDGVVRVYVLLGVAAGFAAYRRTVGYALLRFFDMLCRWLRRGYAALSRAIARPFRWLGVRLRAPIGKAWEKCKKLAKKSDIFFKKGLQPVKKILYNRNV